MKVPVEWVDFPPATYRVASWLLREAYPCRNLVMRSYRVIGKALGISHTGVRKAILGLRNRGVLGFQTVSREVARISFCDAKGLGLQQSSEVSKRFPPLIDTQTQTIQTLPLPTPLYDQRKSQNGTQEAFELLCTVYPRRAGADPRGKAKKAFEARCREGADPTAIVAGAERYRDFCIATKRVESQFVKQKQFWLSRDYRGWEQPWKAPTNGDDRLWV